MPIENRPSRLKADFGPSYQSPSLHLEFEKWLVDSDPETPDEPTGTFCAYHKETLDPDSESFVEEAEEMAVAVAAHIDAMPEWMQGVFMRALEIRSVE